MPTDQPTIQAGIDSAANGDEVVVAPGTYYENINFNGKAITVISSDGPATTILDGAHKGPVVLFQFGELRDSTLSGFTVTHGGAATVSGAAGGGIGIHYSAPSILNSVITANDCAGISSYSSGALIQGNTISNTVDTHAGFCTVSGVGVLVSGQSVIAGVVTLLTKNTIASNSDSDQAIASGTKSPSGGGINVLDADGTILQNNIIHDNSAYEGAGGIQVTGTEKIQIFQNVIYRNIGYSWWSGGLEISSQVDQQGPYTSVIGNNTFYGNDAIAEIGAASDIYFDQSADDFLMANNIVQSTSSLPDSIQCYYPAPDRNGVTPVTFYLSSVNADGSVVGPLCNLTVNLYQFGPLFVDPEHGDFHMQAKSATIDQGNANALPILEELGGNYGLDVTKDADGNPRLQDTMGYGRALLDLGAYEFPGALDQPVVQTVLGLSTYSVAANEKIALTAHSTSTEGVPKGSITFDQIAYTSNAHYSGRLDSTGAASVETGPLPGGLNFFQAIYVGGSYKDEYVSVPVELLVLAAGSQTVLTSSSNPSSVGQTVTFSVTVSSAAGTPTGSVLLIDLTSNNSLATLTLNGQGRASYATSALTAGTHDIEAVYSGDGTYATSTADLEQVVNGVSGPAATLATLTSSQNPSQAGQTVSFQVSVTSAKSTPTGTVTFQAGATVLGTAQLSGGMASYLTATLTVGTHNIQAIYAGNGAFASSQASVQQVVHTATTATVLTSSLNPSQVGQAITFQAKVTSALATPSGTVTFQDGTTVLATAQLSAGIASYLTASLIAGTHNIKAAYGGNATYGSSAADIQQVVTAASGPTVTSTALTSSLNPAQAGQKVTFAATVTSTSGTPSGTVAFLDGKAVIGTAQLSVGASSATASLATTSLTAGTHSITAQYAGNTKLAASDSAVVEEVIQASGGQGDFELAISPGVQTVYRGTPARVKLAVTAEGGFDGPVTFACFGLPALSSCSFSPGTVSGSGEATVTILTTDWHPATSASRAQGLGKTPWGFAAGGGSALALAVLLLPVRIRRRGAYLAVLALAAMALSTGCGDSLRLIGGTPPGTYSIQITGTAVVGGKTLQHSAAETLTVKKYY